MKSKLRNIAIIGIIATFVLITVGSISKIYGLGNIANGLIIIALTFHFAAWIGFLISLYQSKNSVSS